MDVSYINFIMNLIGSGYYENVSKEKWTKYNYALKTS